MWTQGKLTCSGANQSGYLSPFLNIKFWVCACSLFFPLVPIQLPFFPFFKIIFQMPKWVALQNAQCVFLMFLPSLRINYSLNLGMLHLSLVVKRPWRILPWQAIIADNCSFYANLGTRGTANMVVGSTEAHSCSAQDGFAGTALHCNGMPWKAVFWMIISLDTYKQNVWYWIQPREKTTYLSSCSSLN